MSRLVSKPLHHADSSTGFKQLENLSREVLMWQPTSLVSMVTVPSVLKRRTIFKLLWHWVFCDLIYKAISFYKQSRYLIKNILKWRKESDTYLTHVYRHHWNRHESFILINFLSFYHSRFFFYINTIMIFSTYNMC